MKKRTILFLTNYCGLYSGFGRNAKELLTYLYKKYNDKYDFVLAAGGSYYYNPDFERYPFKIHGVIPNNPAELGDLAKDPNAMRGVAYGAYSIEMLVMKFKPDVILAAEDHWGNSFIKDKEFFKYIPTIFWITLDSLPIIEGAFEVAAKTPYYWTWSKFSERAMKKIDPAKYGHILTQYPCFNTSKFYKLGSNKISKIKQDNNIPENSFIIGFVFRNQLRKLVNKLIEGYALFKKYNPHIKNTFLYTHTHYSEGEGRSWNIPSLCKQYGVPPEEVLCTYVCRATKKYFIMPFKGQDIDNPVTGHKGSLVTANVVDGVSEESLNEIYNLFDFYIHPATSGACEMPAVEAALTERIVSCSDYSFGEDIIELNKGSIPIEYDFYTEIDTHFLKSNQRPESIAKVIKKVYEMPALKRVQMGEESRKWALANYSTEINAEQIIKRISEIPQHNWDFQYKGEKKNPNAIIPVIGDNLLWVKTLYKDILNCVVSDDDPGLQSWIIRLQQGQPRAEIENFFRQTANQDNIKLNKQTTLSDLIDKTGRKTILVVIPESLGDSIMSTALLESFSNSYKGWDLYIGTKQENFEIFEGNPYVYKTIPYHPVMDSEIMMTGQADSKPFFDAYCFLPVATQRFLNYLTNHNLAII